MKCIECNKELNPDELCKCYYCNNIMCYECYNKGDGQCPDCENDDCY